MPKFDSKHGNRPPAGKGNAAPWAPADALPEPSGRWPRAASQRQSLRGYWRPLLAERWWTAWLAVYALVWIVELQLVQHLSLTSPQEISKRLFYAAFFVRLVFNTLFVCAACLVLRRVGLAVAAIVAFSLGTILLTYHEYFQRPMSLLTFYNNWGEGLQISGLGLSVLSTSTVVMLSITLGLKLLCVSAMGHAPLTRRYTFSLAAICLAMYCLGLGAINFAEPLDRVLRNGNLGRMGLARGYAQPWLAEMYYLSDDELLMQANRNKQLTSDRLTPVETSFKVGERIVIIQAETIGFEVLGYKIGDEELTPFLNSIRPKSLAYRIQAMHLNGSADADFTVLAGVPALSSVMNYNLPSYKYENTLPQFLAQRGYRCFALHGNSGNFYNRRINFRKMGFHDRIFSEELERDYFVPPARWGMLDADVFNVGLEIFKREPGKVCEFIISLTNHTPFSFVPPAQREIYPHATHYMDNYFNSVRYFDTALANFVSRLPKGTTVMIYGDHTSNIVTDGYTADRSGAIEYVPCLIYNVGEDLSVRQQTVESGLALGGELAILDLITYFRNQVARSHPVVPPEQIPLPKTRGVTDTTVPVSSGPSSN